MDSQDDSLTSYSNRAATDYTGGSRNDNFSFSDFNTDDVASSHNKPTEFYEDEPLKLDFDPSSRDLSSTHGLDAENLDSQFDSLKNHDSGYSNEESSVNFDFISSDINSEEPDDWTILANSLINEKGAPELLFYRKAELENLSELIQFQIEKNAQWYATVAEASKNLSPQELAFSKE
ncbi:hypothetical protein AYI70_g23 [Smittium culicis]|uniref:Uncharacterized protein n=1 Tax=Smittium culicis TaxID=133412 RepID=A0A1R1YIQ4_9FUNG|nr:hypothetical protein AYI70_g23 [Smittium culicis]